MSECDWIDEARQAAASCWCDPETEKTEMDVVLAEAVAKRIAAWMQTAAQAQRNTDYYRGLIVECGEAIGPDAYVCDDLTVSDSVLCAKVPSLVSRLIERTQVLKADRAALIEQSAKDSFAANARIAELEAKTASLFDAIESAGRALGVHDG